MFKQASTYGALLLTAMIAIRANTIVDDTNLSDLYQRQADKTFMSTNLNLLSTNPITIKSYEQKSKLNIAVESMHQNIVRLETNSLLAENEVSPTKKNIDTVNIDLSIVDTAEDYPLSLDRENTINSNLSLLFPRQQIQPRSKRTNLGQ